MDREAWHAVIHGVAKSWTQLNDWTELNWKRGPRELPCPFHPLMTQKRWQFAMQKKTLTRTQPCCCVASVMSDSVWPHRWQPTRLSGPWVLQARTLEWVAISFSNAWKWKVKVKSFSCVRLLATPWTAAYQAPSSMGFSRQEYWNGVPLAPIYQASSLQNCEK